jgi:nucleoside-triphosphatase THEP1
MKEIQIIVTGKAGTGKSTIVLWLEKQLKKKGFLVEIDLKNEIEDYGNETQFRYTLAWERKKRLKVMKKDLKIILKSVQAKNVPTINKKYENQVKAD